MKNFPVYLLAPLLLLTACTTVGSSSQALPKLPQFYQVNEHVYRGGRPSVEGLRLLKERYGVKTVIDVSAPEEEVADEAGLVKQLGMDYLRLPMSIDTRPADDQILAFLKAVLNPDSRPVYVHDRHGRQTTGMMVAIYRTVVEEWGPKTAYREAKDYGFQPFYGNSVQKDYIHQLKDKKQFFAFAGTVPAE
jgi:tyrosine-protein phosphatase SIW14